MRWRGVLVFVVLGGCVSAGEVDDAREKREADIEQDVELVSCKPEKNGRVSATVTVTNRSSERSNYYVQIAFSTPDGTEQLDTAIASVNALKPEQKATDTASSYKVDAAEGDYECEVVDITRFSDEG